VTRGMTGCRWPGWEN